MGNVQSLIPGIRYRIAVNPEGVCKKVYRKELTYQPPAFPKRRSQYASFMYVCPVTKDYIVAARADTHGNYVCYQTFKKRAPALMYTITTAVTIGDGK